MKHKTYSFTYKNEDSILKNSRKNARSFKTHLAPKDEE
jgi:hypothetical protein